MPAPSPITLAVLAGGAGVRMGQPKSLLRIHDEPILTWLHRKLAWPGPTLLITTPGRENPPGHERFTRQAVDAVADQGPLRGVLTALQAAMTEITVITTVDMPGVTQAMLRNLADSLINQSALLGVMSCRKNPSPGTPGEGRVRVLLHPSNEDASPNISPRNASLLECQLTGQQNPHPALSWRTGRGTEVEPFPSAYRRGTMSAIESLLQQNRRSVNGLLGDDRFQAINTDLPDEAFLNLNHPVEFQQFLSSLTPADNATIAGKEHR